MNGYFITTEKANELGFLENPIIASHLLKTIVVITQNDISEHQPNVQLDEK
jgi:hypothetical protein